MSTRTDSAQRGQAGGSRSGPLNLIHRNNSPEPIGMRVSARFDFPGGVTIQEAADIISRRLRVGSPLAQLMARRHFNGKT